MRSTQDRIVLSQGERLMALDWESLGRQVRRQALLAVSLHFAEMEGRDLEGVSASGGSAQAEACGSLRTPRGLKPAARCDLFPGES